MRESSHGLSTFAGSKAERIVGLLQVSLEVGLLFEAPGTVGAGEGPLARVGPLVPHQLGAVGKDFAAEVTVTARLFGRVKGRVSAVTWAA